MSVPHNHRINKVSKHLYHDIFVKMNYIYKVLELHNNFCKFHNIRPLEAPHSSSFIDEGVFIDENLNSVTLNKIKRHNVIVTNYCSKFREYYESYDKSKFNLQVYSEHLKELLKIENLTHYLMLGYKKFLTRNENEQRVTYYKIINEIRCILTYFDVPSAKIKNVSMKNLCIDKLILQKGKSKIDLIFNDYKNSSLHITMCGMLMFSWIILYNHHLMKKVS